MGRETQCRVDFGQESARGKALLESSEVLFRGAFRLKIPFQDIRALEAADGRLRIQFSGGSAVFHLGDAAQQWAARIRNPPGRLDKLGVKAGMKVRLIGRLEDEFRREISERGATLARSKAELVFLAVQQKDDLVELAYLTDGPVWVIFPKGVQSVRANDVRVAGLAAGLVDIKVCSFSETHTGLKFTPRSSKQPAKKRAAAQSR